mgnify:FL=1
MAHEDKAKHVMEDNIQVEIKGMVNKRNLREYWKDIPYPSNRY